MRNRARTIVSALSLLLLVAVVVMWVRSHRITDTLGWHYAMDEPERSTEQDTTLISSDGGVQYSSFELIDDGTPQWLRERMRSGPWFHGTPPEEKPIGFRWRTSPEVAYPYTGNTFFSRTGNTRPGFGASRIVNDSVNVTLGKPGRLRQRIVEVVVPYWAIALTALLPIVLPLCLVAFHRVSRHRRARSYCCPSCGYDLRATPGRCPECGEVTVECRHEDTGNHGG